MTIDILFVHPNASKIIYQELAKRSSAIEPPIWAGMLANSVRNNGFRTEILDAEAMGFNYQECAERILEYRARIICFVVYGQQPSASSQNMEGAVETSKKLKQLAPDIFTLFVGGHLAALPEETLKAEHSIDAVCQNEGVYSIGEILQIEKFHLSRKLLKS